jgi:hypothetical protein
MRKVSTTTTGRLRIVLALAAVMVVGFVLPAFAGGELVHRVSVGGADSSLVSPGSDANFSLVAMERADGSIHGQWQDSFGDGDGGIHVDITCLVVDGNEAWVAGVITQATGIADGTVGLPAATRVLDGGKTGDQISFSWIGLGDEYCEGQTLFALFDVNNGQVKVK